MPRGGAVTGAGKGRGMTKVQPKKDFTSSQNGSRKKPTADIEILHTDTLIKEVKAYAADISKFVLVRFGHISV